MFKLKKSQIPNILTIIRMILAIVVCVFLFVPFGNIIYHIKTDFRLSFLLAGILFAIASITDFLDGYLARKYNWVSDFGKLWDPIADKVLTNSVIIIFAIQGLVPGFVPVVFIARDTIVDATRMIASSKNIIIPANIFGKLKTMTMMISLVVVFFVLNSVDSTDLLYYWILQNGLVLISLLLSVMSGFIYVYKYIKLKK